MPYLSLIHYNNRMTSIFKNLDEEMMINTKKEFKNSSSAIKSGTISEPDTLLRYN